MQGLKQIAKSLTIKHPTSVGYMKKKEVHLISGVYSPRNDNIYIHNAMTYIHLSHIVTLESRH